MHKVAVRTTMDESALERLLGLDSSKIGFYAEVKQKIHELEAANLGLRSKSSEFQALFDSIIDGVIVYDNRGMVQHRNHVCPQFFLRRPFLAVPVANSFIRSTKQHPMIAR